jgi:hypothetical protein
MCAASGRSGARYELGRLFRSLPAGNFVANRFALGQLTRTVLGVFDAGSSGAIHCIGDHGPQPRSLCIPAHS